MAAGLTCFVMSGGAGARLWPLSREDNPKQFHQLAGSGSMVLQTVQRLNARPRGKAPVFLIASERHAERLRDELAGAELAGGGMIFEPVGRNTAAVVAIAALQTLALDPDGLSLVVPSDHEVKSPQQFWDTIEAGVGAARGGRLVVFGVRPSQPETGYGYIEVGEGSGDQMRAVVRFVEKPGRDAAKSYVESGRFFWNTGIFLFRARTMRDAFLKHCPQIWHQAEAAFREASSDLSGTYLALEPYERIPVVSIDYAIMEKAEGIVMIPARFHWSDLGSWQALLAAGVADGNGNVVVGDVLAIGCSDCYLRSHGRLLSATGLKGVAVVATRDATFAAPVSESQNAKRVVETLERSGRLEAKFTPAVDRVLLPGAWRQRVAHWLLDEALPLWSRAGVDERHGGFFEALSFAGEPVMKPKRMRTMARQVYAYCVAASHGWDGPADDLIEHGIAFMARGRTRRGGWARAFNADGTVADSCEDAYDHACVLLALAHAHRAGHPEALQLGEETLAFLDAHLEDERLSGFRESTDGARYRRSNPHMHFLEAFLAWHWATGNRGHLRRAARIVDLFRSHFFDPESWTLGEYFDEEWRPADGEAGQWTEPGHHFEWASLLIEFAERSRRSDLVGFARKLYASAIAHGLNRATGLAYGAVSRTGMPLDNISRSWPQTEAIKAALALDRTDGPDLKPEIEARVGRLFHWHLDPAPRGLWIDRIDERGRAVASDVPASIFYHLMMALTRYLDKMEPAAQASGVAEGVAAPFARSPSPASAARS